MIVKHYFKIDGCSFLLPVVNVTGCQLQPTKSEDMQMITAVLLVVYCFYFLSHFNILNFYTNQKIKLYFEKHNLKSSRIPSSI